MTNAERFKTVEERKRAFKRFCDSRLCKNCEISNHRSSERECALFWLDLVTVAEKPEPCPYCGGTQLEELYTLDREHKEDYTVCCPQCGYRSCFCNTKEEAIVRHNELCRKLRKG